MVNRWGTTDARKENFGGTSPGRGAKGGTTSRNRKKV